MLTDRSLPERHEWKAWFCVAEYERSDFENLSTTLRENDSSGSFAFLGRDAHEQAEIIEALDDDGHEIAFHSHRHHTYGDLSYDEAYDEITTGLAAIEDATGVSPDGFFIPFFELSDDSLRAIEEVGFEWVLGVGDRDLNGVEIHEPVSGADQLQSDETGVVLDCVRPGRVD